MVLNVLQVILSERKSLGKYKFLCTPINYQKSSNTYACTFLKSNKYDISVYNNIILKEVPIYKFVVRTLHVLKIFWDLLLGKSTPSCYLLGVDFLNNNSNNIFNPRSTWTINLFILVDKKKTVNLKLCT